jgi:hypothetical protein
MPATDIIQLATSLISYRQYGLLLYGKIHAALQHPLREVRHQGCPLDNETPTFQRGQHQGKHSCLAPRTNQTAFDFHRSSPSEFIALHTYLHHTSQINGTYTYTASQMSNLAESSFASRNACGPTEVSRQPPAALSVLPVQVNRPGRCWSPKRTAEFIDDHLKRDPGQPTGSPSNPGTEIFEADYGAKVACSTTVGLDGKALWECSWRYHPEPGAVGRTKETGWWGGTKQYQMYEQGAEGKGDFKLVTKTCRTSMAPSGLGVIEDDAGYQVITTGEQSGIVTADGGPLGPETYSAIPVELPLDFFRYNMFNPGPSQDPYKDGEIKVLPSSQCATNTDTQARVRWTNRLRFNDGVPQATTCFASYVPEQGTMEAEVPTGIEPRHELLNTTGPVRIDYRFWPTKTLFPIIIPSVGPLSNAPRPSRRAETQCSDKATSTRNAATTTPSFLSKLSSWRPPRPCLY